MNWRSRKGKSGLVHMLMNEHGISKRKAEKAVNVVFDAMIEALKRGECAELLIGLAWIDSPPPHRRKVRFQTFRNIESGKKFFKFVEYPKREIRFRPHPSLIDPPPKPKRVGKPGRKPRKAKLKLPPPPPPPPQTPADEIWALHQQLVGADLDLDDLKIMLGHCNQNVQRLLEYLRYWAEQGRRFATPKHLIASIGRRRLMQG